MVKFLGDSKQKQTEREQHKKAQEGKKLRGQQSLTSAVSTSHRLTEFEDKKSEVTQQEKVINVDSKSFSKSKKQEEKKHTSHVSSSGRIMPKRMQVLKIKDKLEKEGIPADTVDVDALVDSDLSYPENEQNVMGKFKNTSKKNTKSKSYTTGHRDVDIAYAKQSEDARPDHAKKIDEATTAENSYTEKDIKKNPELLEDWYKNPEKSDIEGIDKLSTSRKRHTDGRGSIVIHWIKGNGYAYNHHREGNKVVAVYIGRSSGDGRINTGTKRAGVTQHDT